MKYKVGDRVKIQSLDWYNENKDEYGQVDCGSRFFFAEMSDWCVLDLLLGQAFLIHGEV